MNAASGADFNWPQPKFAISDARQVLDPAAALFASRGFQNVTMDELAAEIGVAKGTLYAYVGNKSKVLEAVIGQFLLDAEALVGTAADQATFGDQVRLMMKSWLAISGRERNYHRVYYGQFSHLGAAMQKEVRRRADKLAATVRDLVARGQRNGEVAAEFDPSVVAAAIIRISTAAGQGLGSVSKVNSAEAAEQMAKMIISGVTAK